MYLSQCQFVCTLTLVLIKLVVTEKLEAELDEETRTTHTFASRSDGVRSRVVTGTFRFRRVVNNDEAAKISSGRGSGWDIEGCYCETGTRCSCNGNRNRVRMFVRTGSKQPPMPGSMGIPLPPPGMFGGGGGEGGTSTSGSNGGEEESSEPIEPESERLVRRPSSSNRSGCFCNANGCTGSDCTTMNGCVCSQGACWGAACDSRIPVNPNTGTSPMLTSGNLISTSTSTLPLTNSLTNPLQLVRNALFASSPVVSVNGQPTNQPQQSGQQLSANGAVTIGDCSCNNLGCTGSGCANMNGCFCVGSNCWGNACNVNSMVQTSGNLLAPLQQANQMQLPNLAGRLTLPNGQLNGQLTIPTALNGQLTLNNGQAGNLLDIPGLGGAGGILNSLLPGAFGGGGGGGGGLDIFGGGGGGMGGFGGQGMQGMQVVKGMPVKRITASRARRIRGQAARGRPGMEFAATRGRIRPSHTVRAKRIRPIQETDESRTFAVVPDQQMDPILNSLLHLNQLTNEEGQSGNSSVTAVDETINLNDSSLVDSSINQEEPEESVNVFTLTDQWI